MKDPYMNSDTSFKRLLYEYYVYKSLIIAFDFDNTIFDFHKKGHTYERVIELLRRCQELNFILILFTCNNGEKLKKALKYCENLDLSIQYVNKSPILQESIKPYYNILLDDRAGLGEAFLILSKTVNTIIEEKI